ncbi:MAG: 5'/3'-nucleotidase SurE [Gammaproteobacteria bacterium]|nr:5'/3'-nucleotidase SurE [Gammaproteobacteria bacterium]
MRAPLLFSVLLAGMSSQASALNILLTNDDGLTSNVKALYTALKAEGHNVVVSVPCMGQSGMGAAVKFFTPLTPLTEACLNNAAQAGDPGAGAMTKTDAGFDYSDFSYVYGTPVMATAYGLDIAGPKKWGGEPDLVLSGPNEGQNVGAIVVSSGTVSNVQFAAGRGYAAVALSAGADSAGEEDEAGNHADNPQSGIIAGLSIKLVQELESKADNGPLLPDGLALNVNFPDEPAADTPFAFSEIGDYNLYQLKFIEDLSQDPVAQSYGLGDYPYPGMSIGFNSEAPTAEQADDESAVYQSRVAVTAMQVAYDHSTAGQQWMRLRLRDLLDSGE